MAEHTGMTTQSQSNQDIQKEYDENHYVCTNTVYICMLIYKFDIYALQMYIYI
jgi:hypothetical protein